MRKLFEEFSEFFIKNLALIVSLMIGAFIKAAIDIKTKELEWWERVLNVLISVCVGWIAWKALTAFGKDNWTGFIVPLATLFGETLAMWLIVNGSQYLSKFAEKYLKIKD